MDEPEPFEPYERTEEYVEALLHGRRPKPWPDIDQKDAEVLRMASMLNAIGAAPHPRAQFVADLAGELESASTSRPRRFWRLSRRTLLRSVAGAAALVLVGAGADRAVTSLSRPSLGPGWVAVASAAEVAPGAAKRFLANGMEGYLLNLHGDVSAVSALCTHLPCVLRWAEPEQQFVCPCHQAVFATTGEWRPTADYDRPLAPLPAFEVRRIGGLLYVYAPGSAEEDAEDEEYRHP